MADGALKRRIEYEMKNDKLLSTHDEERNLHEAYQFLMREYEARYKMAMVRIILNAKNFQINCLIQNVKIVRSNISLSIFYSLDKISIAAAATERAFGSEYYQERNLISDSYDAEADTSSNSKDSLSLPDEKYGYKKGTSSRDRDKRGKSPRSSRDKSPRPSPMPERPERKKRQPKGLSAFYKVLEFFS